MSLENNHKQGNNKKIIEFSLKGSNITFIFDMSKGSKIPEDKHIKMIEIIKAENENTLPTKYRISDL